jgi:hypothetical protein
MTDGVFVYLEQKMQSGLEESSWKDDGRKVYEYKYLADMQSCMRKMDRTQADTAALLKKIEHILKTEGSGKDDLSYQ